MNNKKTITKLLVSAISLFLTAVCFVGVAFAWFSVNDTAEVTGIGLQVKTDGSQSTGDFDPGGSGAEDMVTYNVFAGDYMFFDFSMNNQSAAVKNYAVSFTNLHVTLPTQNVTSISYYTDILSVDHYEYYADDSWHKYYGFDSLSVADKQAFFEKFVAPSTDSLDFCVLPWSSIIDGTPTKNNVTQKINESATPIAFVPFTDYGSYYDYQPTSGVYQNRNNDGSWISADKFYGMSLKFDSTGAFGFSSESGTSGFMLVIRMNGEKFAETEIDGVTYRMCNSNAYMWQSLVMTLTVTEV